MALSEAMVFPTIPAADMARAKEFYSNTLGLAVQREDNEGTTFECGNGSKLLVYKSEGAGTSQATYAAFKVADFDSAMNDLKGKGVTFEDYDMPNLKTVNGVAEQDGMKGAWFKDSEGNILSLVQVDK